MKRNDIVKRVNQRLDGGFNSWEDMKYEFDDAIIEINNRLHSTFPMMSEILLGDDSRYCRFTLESNEPGKDKITLSFVDPIDARDYKNTHINIQYKEITRDIIPSEYIRSVVIPYVVMRMLQREDEYGNLQTTMMQEYSRGLDLMFANYYELVPKEYIKEDSDMQMTSKHNHNNPYSLQDDINPFDPLS